MAIVFVQEVANQGVNVTSLALTLASNTTNGNGCIIVVGARSGTLADPTFTGTGFGTAVLLKKEASGGASGGTVWIYGFPAQGGGATLTLHCASAIIGACLAEFSGIDTTFPTDGTNGNFHAQAASQTTTPGSITTTNANDLIITVSDWVGVNTITTPPSGYTALTQAQTTGTNSNTVQGYYEIVTSTTTTNPAIVLSTAQVAWVAAIAAVKAAAAVTVFDSYSSSALFRRSWAKNTKGGVVMGFSVAQSFGGNQQGVDYAYSQSLVRPVRAPVKQVRHVWQVPRISEGNQQGAVFPPYAQALVRPVRVLTKKMRAVGQTPRLSGGNQQGSAAAYSQEPLLRGRQRPYRASWATPWPSVTPIVAAVVTWTQAAVLRPVRRINTRSQRIQQTARTAGGNQQGGAAPAYSQMMIVKPIRVVTKRAIVFWKFALSSVRGAVASTIDAIVIWRNRGGF